MIEHQPDGNPCAICGKFALSHRFTHGFADNPENPGYCVRCKCRESVHRNFKGHRKRIDDRIRVRVRPQHTLQGDPCTKCVNPECFQPAHTRESKRKGWNIPAIRVLENQILRKSHIADSPSCIPCGKPASAHRKVDPTKGSTKGKWVYVGIDGEGQGGRKGDDHRYILLAARSEEGSLIHTARAEPGGRLTTEQCLDMILSLPISKRAKVFSFSFNYDLTKMLTDLSEEALYLLFRPELRQRGPEESFLPPYHVQWKGYQLNLQGTKFTVGGYTKKEGVSRYRKVVVWDLFKFFQSKFVNALKAWQVGSEALHERMTGMKDKRGAEYWDQTDAKTLKEIEDYCLEECQCIAELGHKLTDAHTKAGLRLRSYYGAGSSGAAMLDVMHIKEQNPPVPDAMKQCAASGFFGGRFENSVIGAMREPLFNYDISSAYPYATAFLPCLLHATWRKTSDRNDIKPNPTVVGNKREEDILDKKKKKVIGKVQFTGVRKCTAALVRYSLGDNPGITSWGPFPFRAADGSISFPIESGGGWVWRDEFLAGERIFSHVKFEEAWICESDCDCQPFSKIPSYYFERLVLGKDGAGLVLKLAVNSCYGKLAQSVGNALYNNWIWAGIITSVCRAMILDALGMHKNWKNLLTIATDGIYTRERLKFSAPRETNTGMPYFDKDKGKEQTKPLGGWEEKSCPKGCFFARPGIYFPIDPSKDEIKEVRARGVGRGVVLEHWKSIVDTWEKEGIKGIAKVPDVVRFCGAKTSVHRGPKGYVRSAPGRKNTEGGTLPSYGNWIKRKVEMSFDPKPKRDTVSEDGVTLVLRKFPKTLMSLPYDRAMLSKESLELKLATQEILEQKDGDFADMDMEDSGGME